MDPKPGDINLGMCPRQKFKKEYKSLNAPCVDAAAINSLTLEEYHETCFLQFSQ
jgi:hypothetical protein